MKLTPIQQAPPLLDTTGKESEAERMLEAVTISKHPMTLLLTQ